MRRARIAVACCTVLAGSLAVTPAYAGKDASRASVAMVDRLNELRARNGVAKLRVAPALARSAQRYSHWMLAHDHPGHSSTIKAEMHFSRLGETLAYHLGWRPRVALTLAGWRRSGAHRPLLLSAGFGYVGVGFSRGRLGRTKAVTWVVQLGG